MKIKKLEAIRGFAALYVIANHLAGWTFLKPILHPLVRLPFRFAQEVVILFFLLSGFVIFLAENKKDEINFPRYFLKRVVRIYPIMIAAFILSAIVALINKHHFVIADGKALIGNFFMLQDLPNKAGNIEVPFLDNSPLWTLSYEFVFYLMFYPVYIFFIKEKKTKLSANYIVLAMSVTGWILYMLYPNHLFLVLADFTIWWTGVACAQVYLQHKTFSFINLKEPLVCLTIMMLLFAIPVVQFYINGLPLSQIQYPVITWRHYMAALLFVITGILWWKVKLLGFNTFVAFFERVAPISYALYITHFIFLRLKIPGINPYLELIIQLGLIFTTAYVLEMKYQPYINKLVFKKQSNKPGGN